MKLVTGIEQVERTVQIVDVLAMCGSFALPFDIRCVVVLLILSEAIIVGQFNAR